MTLTPPVLGFLALLLGFLLGGLVGSSLAANTAHHRHLADARAHELATGECWDRARLYTELLDLRTAGEAEARHEETLRSIQALAWTVGAIAGRAHFFVPEASDIETTVRWQPR